MKHQADIDLDFANREDILGIINHIPATQINKGKVVKHRSGVYVHEIPYNPSVGGSAIEFKEADSRGYFKIDFLNVSVYQYIRDYDHYDKLLAMEPPWDRLSDYEFTKQVIQIANHPDKVAQSMPDSIPRLAMFIAALRPAKKHLLGTPWDEMEQTIWDKSPDGKYAFKHAHSLSYAVLVALHMTIIDEQERNK